MRKRRIAIFASGKGSNAQKIHQYSIDNISFEVVVIVSNRSNAGVLDYAVDHGIATMITSKKQLHNTDEVQDFLKSQNVDFIALAGFLLLIPSSLVIAYPKRIINIHPAILPNYGGKGMYGHHVHEAVSANGDTTHGMTIHFVNEKYDEGSIIFQAKRRIKAHDDTAEIAAQILVLEHAFYPQVVAGVVSKID